MGRPPLPVGTSGEIRHYKTTTGYRAETLFRDLDGETRAVKRSGKTKGDATRKLKEALRDRQHLGSEELTRNSLLSTCVEQWLEEVKRTERGTTYDRYRCRMSRILPALGKLRLGEVGTGTCDRFLTSLLVDVGLVPSTVRGYRSALSGIMGYAVRMGALTRNPVHDVAEIRGKGKKSRALTPAERVDLLAKLDGDPLAVQRDLPSLIRYMLGSGARIGEVLALRWGDVDLDLGTVVHGATLVRETRSCRHCGEYRKEHPKPARPCPTGGKTWVPGAGGLVLHPPKTAAGVRIIRLPSFVIDMLRLRYPGPGYEVGPVFPNHNENSWRDPINTVRMIREWRVSAGFEWFTSHVCRHTAITVCSQAGVEPRELSGHVGHNDPGFTARTYYDMRPMSGAVAEALDAAYRVAG